MTRMETEASSNLNITSSSKSVHPYILVGLPCCAIIIFHFLITRLRFRHAKNHPTNYSKKKISQRFPRKISSSLQLVSQEEVIKYVSQSLSDYPKYALSLIIPAYNEEKRLEVMLQEAVGVLEQKCRKDVNFNCEVILVDDGSSDGTVSEFCRVINSSHLSNENDVRIHYKILKMPVNSGKGRAVSEGFLASLGENILFADADGSTDFESLHKFEELSSQHSQSDVLICGSRCHINNNNDSIVKRSLFRLFLMKMFHLYLNVFGVVSVSDTQCGFKMMNRSAARKIIPWIHISGWIFDVEMILLAEMAKVKIFEVPVNWKEMNGTKLSLALDSLKMAKDLFRLRLNYYLGIWRNK